MKIYVSIFYILIIYFYFKITTEAWAGIEPAYIPFAEECLTTWLPGRYYILSHVLFNTKVSLSRGMSYSLRSPHLAARPFNYLTLLEAIRQFFGDFFLRDRFEYQ